MDLSEFKGTGKILSVDGLDAIGNLRGEVTGLTAIE
jgi:hypothetical protein